MKEDAITPSPTVKFPTAVEKQCQSIANIIYRFCDEYLNEEYRDLSISLLLKLARKRQPPILSGQPRSWAAGIVHA